MFKTEEGVRNFIEKLEKFVNAAITNKFSNEIEDVTYLNRKREELEEFIKITCGITVYTNTTDTLTCPDCGGAMKERANRQTGQKFYGCVKYPDCKGTRDSDGLSREDREERRYKQEQVSHQSGFSFNKEKRNPVTEVTPSQSDVVKNFNPFAK